MTTYTQPTGNAGTMRMDDDGTANVDLYLLGVNELVAQVPWTYTVNGVQQGWRSFRLEPNLAWQKLTTVYVGTTQTFTFSLGSSGNVKLGGPTDFPLALERADVAAAPGVNYVNVKTGNVYRRAIPYVKADGVWKLAQPWAKQAGLWKPTN